MTERDKHLYHQDGPYIGQAKGHEQPRVGRVAALSARPGMQLNGREDRVARVSSGPNLAGQSIMECAERLAAAVEALPIVEWIAVKDRKPADQQHVLIWPRDESGMGVVSAIFTKRYKPRGEFMLYGVVHKPTHWMPLPKAPKP